MENVYSPLTNKNKVSKIKTLDINRIKAQYFNQFNIEVSRFFEGVDELAIYECLDSGLKFYYPFSTVSDGKFYADLAQDYKGYYNPWKWEHEQAYRLIQQNDKVLEIGCGNGQFLKKVKEKTPYARGLDFNPVAQAQGIKQGLNISVETIKEHSVQYPDHYDIICAFQLFEHLNNVEDFINDTLKCLKKGGLLFIGVPNNDSYFFKNDTYHTLNLPPHHMLLWNHKALHYLEKIFSLEIVRIENQPTNKINKGMMYNLWLSKLLGARLARPLAFATRFLIKQLPLFTKDGLSVIATYKKQ
ncbi:MAG: class I SAM-dependent methyltransferase [Cytophagales bacterium]|nr:MAG: class I SAM-dependent methyltransferase [Cytophagales bacterium]